MADVDVVIIVSARARSHQSARALGYACSGRTLLRATGRGARRQKSCAFFH